MRDLIPLVQFKNRKKHPWRSVTFSKVAEPALLKVALLHGCFSRFLNCTNGNKLRNASHIHANKYDLNPSFCLIKIVIKSVKWMS